MSKERSNNHTNDVPHRAAAHDHSRSGVSLPAVSPVQKTTAAENAEDNILPERPGFGDIKPFQLKPVYVGSAQQAKREETRPFQLPGSRHVVQGKDITVTNSQTRGRRRDKRDIDHGHLMKLAAKGNLIPDKRGYVDIGQDESWSVPIDDVIDAVEEAMGFDDNEDIAQELDDLLGELKKIKERTRSKQPKRRKNEQEKEEGRPPRKKNKVGNDEDNASGEKMVEEEEDEESTASPAAKADTMQTEELSSKIDQPEEALKFIAWNANHFGETDDLDEEKIKFQFVLFGPQRLIDRLKQSVQDKELSGKVTAHLQVMVQYAEKLPLFSNISAVNKLMEAAHGLSLLLAKLKGSYYNKTKQKEVAGIIGSLKKHYMIEHSKHLMKVHPNLIMGFNEVGKGVAFMKQQLEGKPGNEDEKEGGVKVETGPKLQSISISVKDTNKAILEHNKAIAKAQNEEEEEYDSEEEEENTPRKKLTPLKKKDHQYSDDDYYEHYKAYTDLGQRNALLKSGQIEYYPIAFNSAKFEYRGSMAISSKGDQIKQTEISWTKNPFLFSYTKFRPIVVHRLAKKDADGKASKEEVWYGMVHTSPKGDEFDRRKIYDQQLNGSLPKLKSMAKGMNAQLIIGGDYYIAEEALVSTPPNLRNVRSRAKSISKDDVRMTSTQISDESLTAGSAIGRSKVNNKLSTGKINEIRNLQHPDSNVPYNYKGALGNMHLQDARSLTGTNENEAGLQSADYFIVDPSTSKTFQTGVIDPFTGKPTHMETEDKEISNSWFSFSDHVPVMLVVSGKEKDEAVANAFPSNKSHFPGNIAHSINPFDLRFLQLSNVMARLLNGNPAPGRELGSIKEAFAKIQQQRKSGTYTEQDMVTMKDLQSQAEKLLDPEDEGTYISAAAFEPSESSNAHITTVLHQVWTDILALKPDDKGKALMEHIQAVRMIIKEDKINAAYSLGLKGAHEANRLEEAKELKPVLSVYLGKKAVETLDARYESVKAKRSVLTVKTFILAKGKLQEDLLADLMTKIDLYLSSNTQLEKDEKYKNIQNNSALVKDITGKKAPMSSIRGTSEKGTDSNSSAFSTARYYPSDAKEGGIPNRGTDCFLNSVLQLLSLPAYDSLTLDTDVRALVEKIKKKEDIQAIAVEDLRSYLFFLDQVATLGGQEDAAELLGQLMNEIDRQQTPALQQQLPQHSRLFSFVASNTRTITEAENMQHRMDLPDETQAEEWTGGSKTIQQAPENVLSIPVTGAAGLIEWMNTARLNQHDPDYSNFNTIEWAYVADNWFSIRKERETTIFKRLPQVLTISLKRFSRTGKISTPFIMPQQFEMYEQGQDGTVLKSYALQGFIYHRGENMTDGHYWTHRKDKEGNWSKAEDAAVAPSKEGNADTEGTLRHDIDNAYVYTYVLTGEGPVDDPGLARSLDNEHDDSSMTDIK